jgi:hypothetical protein
VSLTRKQQRNFHPLFLDERDFPGAAIVLDLDDQTTLSLDTATANSATDIKNEIVYSATGSARPAWSATSFNGTAGLDVSQGNHYLKAQSDVLIGATEITMCLPVMPTLSVLTATPAWQASMAVVASYGNYNQAGVHLGRGLSGISGETMSARHVGSSAVQGALGMTFQNMSWKANEPFVLTFTTGSNGTRFYRNHDLLVPNGSQGSYDASIDLSPDAIGLTSEDLGLAAWFNNLTAGSGSKHIAGGLYIGTQVLGDYDRTRLIDLTARKKKILFPGLVI